MLWTKSLFCSSYSLVLIDLLIKKKFLLDYKGGNWKEKNYKREGEILNTFLK